MYVQYTTIHMACCLSRYRKAWWSDHKPEGEVTFTPDAFDQQLRRALCCYNYVLEAPMVKVEDFSAYNGIRLDQRRIVDDFTKAHESDNLYAHFLPWDAGMKAGSPRSLPVTLVQANQTPNTEAGGG